MKALLLAAGIGRRLGGAGGGAPKALLRFGGKSLLERHVAILRRCGIVDISVIVGHESGQIAAEAARLESEGGITLIENPRFSEGSVVSLWNGRSVLASGEAVLLMDADVLYDIRLMRALLDAPFDNCFLLDRDIEPGEEPVKLCIRDGRIVDFRKRPERAHDWHGESVGFFRFAPAVANELGQRCAGYVVEGRVMEEYEEAIRDMVIAARRATFGFAEITGLPWIEIDFPEDVARATGEVLPRLVEICG